MSGTRPVVSPATLGGRLRRSLAPVTVVRSAVLTVLVLLAAPVLAGLALLVLGLLAGQSLIGNTTGALAQVGGITVILFGTAALVLLFGILSVALLHSSSYNAASYTDPGRPRPLRRAAGGALRALPRLVAALLVTAAALLVALIGWPVVTAVFLVVAGILEVRHLRAPAAGERARTSPGVRRALVWAIPFLPVVATGAALVALVPAALDRPTSVRQLVTLAFEQVRTQKLALTLLAVLLAGGSAVLSWGGVALSTLVQGGSSDAGSWAFLGGTLILGAAVLLLIVYSGAVLAVFSPAPTATPAGTPPGTATAPGTRSGFAGVLKLATPLMRRTAIVTVFALGATLLVPTTPALAAAGDTSAVDSAPTEASATPTDASDGTAAAVDPTAANPLEQSAPAEPEPAPEATTEPPAEPAPSSDPLTAQRGVAAAAAAPSAVTAVLGQSGSLGEDLLVNVTVSDPADAQQTVFPGTIEVYAGTTLLTTADAENIPWGVYVPTGPMQAGPTDLRVVYVPAAGAAYAGSETTLPVTLDKARTAFRVSAVPAAGSGPLAWGEKHVVTAAITSAADGDFSLDVVDTSRYPQTVIATVPVSIVNGEAQVSIDLTGLFGIGQANYMLKVVENDRYGPGGTEAPGQQITTAPTTLTLDAASSQFPTGEVPAGQSVTVWATVGSAGSAPRTPTGSVKFTAPGYTLAPAPIYNGRAVITFTPTGLGPITLTAAYQGDTVFQGSTADPADLTVVSVRPATPTFRWYGALTRDDAHVEIVFSASPGLSPPTGLITIVDQGNKVVGQASLVNGVFDAPVTLREGTSSYRALYPGDDWYQPYTVYLPDQTLEPYKPVVTLTTTNAAPLEGETFTLNVSVTDVPLTLVQSVTLLEEGSPTRTFTLDADGKGSLTVTRTWSMLNTFNVSVDYLAAANLTPTVSDPVLVDVRNALIPDIRLSTTTPADQLRAGSPVDVVVTAFTLPGRTETGLVSGAVVTIGDKSVVLHTSADGLTGTVRLTAPSQGGPFTLQGSTTYGPNKQPVQTPVLHLTALAPDTTITITGGSQAIGWWDEVHLQASLPKGFTVTAGTLDVTAEIVRTDAAGTVLSTESQTLTLTRSGTDNLFTGILRTMLTHAGTYTMTVTAAGDGVSVGAGTGVLQWLVTPAETVVTVETGPYAPAGSDHVVGSRVAAVDNSGHHQPPAPTGTVTYTAIQTGASCTAAVGATCTIPESSLVTGDNIIQASYSGDADNAPSQGRATVVASAQTIHFTASFSAAPSTWWEGQTVTATWNVERLGRPASGYVTAQIGGASCVGYVTAGSCQLTIPVNEHRSGPDPVYYAIYFTSYDAEHAQDSVHGYVSLSSCVVPRLDAGTLALISGSPCDANGTAGYVAGSVIEVTANAAPAGYVYDQWSLNGIPQQAMVAQADGAARYRMTLWTNRTIGYTTRYQPTCFTLTLTPAQIDEFTPGQARSITRPNCTDPFVSSAAELKALRDGAPRYAAGTVVTVTADYSAEDVRRASGTILPGLSLTGFTGAQPVPGNPNAATVLMDRDRTVAAQFTVADCSIVELHRGDGGTIAIESAYRPDNSATLAPYTGACTDSSGRSGYVPGTRLTLRVTPDPDTVLESITSVTPVGNFWCSTGIDCGHDESVYDLHLVGNKPDDVQQRTRKVVLGGNTIFGATFAQVRCIRVDTVVWSLASIVDGTKPVTDLSVDLAHSAATAPGCGGHETTSSDVTVGVNLQRTTSAWYLKTGTISASTTRPTLTHLPASTSTVRWTNSAAGAASSQGVDRKGTGPTVNLAQVSGDSVTIQATWVGDACRVPVKQPQGGTLIVELQAKGAVVPAEKSACPEGQMAPTDKGFLFAAPLPDAPDLVPFFSVAKNYGIAGHLDPRLREAPDGRWYVKDWMQVLDADMLRWMDARLEYCAPLGITAASVGDEGFATELSPATINSAVTDDGGCPPNYALPGRTVILGLSAFGDYWYSLSPDESPLPKIVIDAHGVSTPSSVRINFGVRCQTLSVGANIALTTPANCPGTRADNRYIRGTAVQVDAALGENDEFRGWSGVQKSDGTTAWVVLSEDRSVGADIHTVGDAEFAGNLISNGAQRLLGYVVTAATGVIMAELLVVQGVMLAVRGAAAGLAAAGIKGSVIDAITSGLDVVEAQLEMVTLLATCLSSWSSGTDTPLTDIPVDSRLAQGINMTSDQITEKLVETMEKQLEKRGNKTAGGMIGAVGQGRALTDAFLTNLDAYTRPAAEGWSNMTGEVSSCMVAGAKNAGWAS